MKKSEIPDDWRDRVPFWFDRYFWYPFSPPHVELWEWASMVGVTFVDPFIAIWPRGRGKSTNGEAIAADLGARDVRRYCIYVSGTQDQADKHVATIATMLEGGYMPPAVREPLVGKNGSRTWNRTMVTTSNGYTVEAVGLNKAVRGQKIDWARPDLIIFDDVDERHDTDNAVKKKGAIITSSVLPSAAQDCAILFLQNLIHEGSIAHMLSKRPDEEGAADYLTRRIISGPHPAVDDLNYEMVKGENGTIQWKITDGTPVWEGFGLDVCEAEINRDGPTSFEAESQHDIDADNPDALLNSDILDKTRVSSHPDLTQIVVGVDPAGGAGAVGIVAVGVAELGNTWHGYTIADHSTAHGTAAADWAVAAIRCYHAVQADCIVVERNFGGDMVKDTIRHAELKDAEGEVILRGENIWIAEVSASRGKEVRAQPVASVFQLGRAHHVGHFPKLERQWTGWEPGTKPSPDRLDAEVWAYTYLGLANAGPAVIEL